MKHLFRLFYFLKYAWREISLSLLLGFAAICSAIGLIGTSAYLIVTASFQPSMDLLQIPIVGVRFFGLSRAVFRYLERLVSHSVNLRLLAKMRSWFFRKLISLDTSQLVDIHGGELLSRIVSDIETLEQFYIRVIAPPVVAVLITCGVGFFSGYFDIRLAIIVCLGLVINGTCIPIITYVVNRENGKIYVESRGALISSVVDSLQGIDEIAAYGLENKHLNELDSLNYKYISAQKRQDKVDGLSNAASVFTANFTMFCVLLFSISLVQTDMMDGVWLAVLVLVSFASFEAVQPLAVAAQYLERCAVAAKRLYMLVDSDVVIKEDDKQLIDHIDLEDIVISNLNFRYHLEQPHVLSEINLVLSPDKRVAMLGANGSGKTTLINLILRLWAYEDGNIKIGKADLGEYSTQAVRRYISVMEQKPYIFSGSIRDNLLIGNPEANDEQLWFVIEQLGLLKLINHLPNGLETWIGERGHLLSGGEKQRIANARVLLCDSEFYFFDEPTVYLDMKTKRKVTKTILSELTNRKKGVLWITHDLVGMELMDEIVVFEKGRIVERGIHDELIKRDGLYSQLWHIEKNTI